MLGFILAATATVTLLRVLPLRRVLGWATPIDLGFTALLIWLFHGTLAGMTGAAVGGLLLAVGLTLGRWLCGYSRPALVRRGRFSWRYIETPVRSPVLGWMAAKLRPIRDWHGKALQRTTT